MARAGLPGALISRILDWRWPGARTSGIARTRFIDDLCQEALRDGFEQVVILGAGFDARAYRLPGIEKIRVFEVDHPDTSTEKQRSLRQMLHVIPPHIAFVAVDLQEHHLDGALRAAGFDPTRRALFIWEGVTNYLSAGAVDATFRFMRTTAPGSRILFTYIHRDVLDNPASFAGTRLLVRTLRNVGESWTFGFDPAELPAYLQQRGLLLRSDVGSIEYRACYLGQEGHHLYGYAFYRIAEAEVAPRSASVPSSASAEASAIDSKGE